MDDAVRVDPDARTVRVEGGATIAGVDHASARFGLAVPLGTVSTTGVGGLTLGGGIGHLTRRWGLSIDNLLEADVVLADGRLVTASEDREPDLFWALRGGGGNFGVVTAIEIDLFPITEVFGGMTVWPAAQAREVLAAWAAWAPTAPDAVTTSLRLLRLP
ncbi:MAG TPA: FAD-binding protein, partial [Solirubrobacteraceae bacterium]|nr:FAD-binding protein [Solirubrobacteraceae bacterium]